jgi:phosphatidate cytidylyltransferase
MKRLITAAIALPVLVASIVVKQLELLFVLLVAAAAIVGLYEYWLLAKRKQIQPDVAIGFGGAAALLVSFYFDAPINAPILLVLILVVLTIAVMASAMLKGAPFDKMISSVGVTIGGVMYVVFLGGHLLAVRSGLRHSDSMHLLGFFFMVLMGSDTGAYYVGGLLGKHKLAPKISPGKTWEGALGGMLASLAMAAAAYFWFFKQSGGPGLHILLPLAALMNVLGVLGDLTESALKRGSNTKDTAQIIPGHGGVLDRLDSLLFNAPVIYYFARFYFH